MQKAEKDIARPVPAIEQRFVFAKGKDTSATLSELKSKVREQLFPDLVSVKEVEAGIISASVYAACGCGCGCAGGAGGGGGGGSGMVAAVTPVMPVTRTTR